MSIQEEIQAKFTSFSIKEKRIATYLLSNSETVSNINISDLANLTETSPATVTRFAKKMNCNSFVDLKIQLNSAKTEIKQDKNPKIKNEVYDYYSRVIRKTEEITNSEDIKELVSQIERAERIFIFGVGSSGLTALEFTQRLLRMGLNANGTSDSHMMVINSSIVKEKDLVIGISASGETKEVLEALGLAKKNAATVAGITCFPKSRLAKLANVKLNAYSSLFIGNKRFINSQFSIMYLIDILTTMMLENEELNKKMSRTISVIANNDE